MEERTAFRTLSICMLLVFAAPLCAQIAGKLSGVVKDRASAEALVEQLGGYPGWCSGECRSLRTAFEPDPGQSDKMHDLLSRRRIQPGERPAEYRVWVLRHEAR
jgi:hypothetical protein